MAKYVPPHRRTATSSPADPLAKRYTLNDIRFTDDPFIKHFILASPVFDNWLAAKAQYRENSAVDEMFQNRRESMRQDLGSPSNSPSFVFRDQFKAAMHDVDLQVGGAISNRVQSFLDLGCAPGGFSKWVLEKNKGANGLGVTLPLSEHGLPMAMEDWSDDEHHRYELMKADLTDLPESFYSRVNDAFPQGLCSLVICGARFRDGNTTRTRSTDLDPDHDHSARDKLELSQLLVALRVLEPGGTLIFVASLKLMPATVDNLVFLREHFEVLTPTKGNHLHGTRSSYYLVCQGFKGEEVRRLKAIEDVEAVIGELNKEKIRTGGLSVPEGDEMDMARRETEFVVAHFRSLWERQTAAMAYHLQCLTAGHKMRGRGGRGGWGDRRGRGGQYTRTGSKASAART